MKGLKLMNLSQITINLTNIYTESSNLTKVCEVNQYKALESVQMFPKIVLYTTLSAFLICYIYILFSAFIKNPKNKEMIKDRVINILTLLLAVASYFLIYTTGKITEATSQYFEYILWFLIGGLLLSLVFQHGNKNIGKAFIP